MDLLVDAEILADDSWSVVAEVTLKIGGVEPGSARAEILVTPTTSSTS